MPDIQNPQTYAEWYWKNSVDAGNARSEEIEKTLVPSVLGLVDSIPNQEDLPPYVRAFLDTMKAPEHPNWDNVVLRFLANTGSAIMQRVLGHEMKGFDYKVNAYLQSDLLTPDMANILKMRNKITDELWLARQNAGGFSEVEGAFVYESQKPYPSIPDLIQYARYAGEPTSPKALTWELIDVSPNDWPLWEWLSRQKLNTEQVSELYKRKLWSEQRSILELNRLGWLSDDVNEILNLSYSFPNAMLMIQGGLFQGYSKSEILEDVTAADIHPKYQLTYWDAVLTKPATQDLIAYQLRIDPNLDGLSNELLKTGVHPYYHGLYKELAYEIPPVADIITMAVREAFTPSIASRFGQYEDLPQPYVEWVQKKGLTKEWAERYWAAHWSLPSPQQGFEMLHRGIIGEGDLNLLLRALDVMPFWRDKLTAIAYRPLSRVDVRRMYATGILDKSGVLKAYRDLGYNDFNANLMTNFTIEYTRGKPKTLTQADIVNAYKRHLIDESTMRNMLSTTGLSGGDLETIVKAAQSKLEWTDKQESTSAIENLYKKGKYSDVQARTELNRLAYPQAYIDTLLQQWQAKSEAEKVALWTTAQTLSFFKAGLINEDRARQEFTLLGYDKEHTDMYVKSVSGQTA